jgi:hypothetical protein
LIFVYTVELLSSVSGISFVMGKYLIEIKNGGDKTSCIRAIEAFLDSRSALVESVDWGCIEEERKAWLIIKTNSKQAALQVVPAAYRQNAKTTKLHKFNRKGGDLPSKGYYA